MIVNGERVLQELPQAIFIWFENAKWQIGDLPVGVYPLTPKAISWDVNKHTRVKARRKGFYIRPNFCGTAHWVQGANLDAVIADNGEVVKKVQLFHIMFSTLNRVFVELPKKCDAIIFERPPLRKCMCTIWVAAVSIMIS